MTGVKKPALPPGVVGSALGPPELQSSWDRPRGRGCELVVPVSSGARLWVICTGIETVEATLAQWRARVGRRVEKAVPIVAWPIAGGGLQTTLEISLDDGFRFEADLIDSPPAAPSGAIETEWVFEGTPGTEMGSKRPG